jgi:hypothetical protein
MLGKRFQPYHTNRLPEPLAFGTGRPARRGLGVQGGFARAQLQIS